MITVSLGCDEVDLYDADVPDGYTEYELSIKKGDKTLIVVAAITENDEFTVTHRIL